MEKNTTPRHDDYGYLKKIIFDLIIRDGRHSHFSVRQEFKKKFGKKIDKSTVINTFKKILLDRLIGRVDFFPKSGGTEVICGLTTEGLKYYSSKYGMTIHDLWNVSFNFYKKDYEINYAKLIKKKLKFSDVPSTITYSIDDHFTLFENKVLKVSRNHLNPFSVLETLEVANRVFTDKEKNFKEFIQFLEPLALGKGSELAHNHLIHQLLSTGLVYLSGSKEKAGWKISPFGILFLLKILNDKHDWKKIEKIISKNEKVLPLVFGFWSRLKNYSNLNTKDLLKCLLYPHFEDKKLLHSSPNIDLVQQLINFQRSLELITRQKLEEEYEIGIEITKKWSKGEKCYHYLFDEFFGYLRPEILPILTILSSLDKQKIQKEIKSFCINIEEWHHLSADKINPSAFKIISNYYEPLRKLGELHRLVAYTSSNFALKSVILNFEFKDRFRPIQETIAFYFYIFFSSVIGKDRWDLFLMEEENEKLRDLWNGRLNTIIQFGESNLHNLGKLKIM